MLEYWGCNFFFWNQFFQTWYRLVVVWNYNTPNSGSVFTERNFAVLVHLEVEKIRFWFFFLTGIYFTGTDDWQDIRGREGTIFIPLFRLHPLTNIQTCEVNTTCFKSHHLLLPGCYSMSFTTFLIYYLSDRWWNIDFLIWF